ncbi:integrator complex subunit 15 [Diorhabda carinulata]|uniref:integrator complex subunit 15 n=1 Tax=Diorhabda sublineata TaxID=1163346 RepID=UPI0024E110FB|nr:integrator complex subunit 15 [Diorhabda sublineata]XP_057653983.1 integrator complex subunit 15 [Diorhabda carinulata]
MSSFEVNLKQTLRKIEYPLCAKEALYKIVELICGRITSIKNMDLALDLMAEFVFYEVDRRGYKRSQPLTPLLELQLIKILHEYFDNISSESGRNTVFLSLFSGNTANLRINILIKLTSVSIGIPSSKILSSASAWMQQLGNTSPNSCKLAEGIIQDYFHFYVSNTDKILVLPKISPQFTANFLTAVAENYFNPLKKEVLFPPQVLLETITLWISQNPNLCTAAQHKQALLPPGAIAMEATTPIAGLFRWCILAPIHKQTNDHYNNLHLALLNSVTNIQRTVPPKAIYAQHVTQSINPILSYVNDLKNKQDLKLDQILNEDALQLCLDRFAQAVQIINSVNAMYGHVDDLFYQLKLLPFNKLMNIVINNYKKNKVIVI